MILIAMIFMSMRKCRSRTGGYNPNEAEAAPVLPQAASEAAGLASRQSPVRRHLLMKVKLDSLIFSFLDRRGDVRG